MENNMTIDSLPRYQSHKIVGAVLIAAVSVIDGGGILTPADESIGDIEVNGDYMAKHNPVEGGYFVIYEDGYSSFSPAKAFEEGYTPVPDEEPEYEFLCHPSNKVTQRDVDTVMAKVAATTVTHGGKKITVVTVTMPNGFTITETATCVDPANYDEEIGVSVCCGKIADKVWFLLGYELQTKLGDERDVSRAAVIRALTELLTSAKGQDSLSDEEIDNGIKLADSVLGVDGDYQQRARTELAELDARIGSLDRFIQSETFASLTDGNEKDRMERQLTAMRTYRTVLNQRVANFQVG